MFPSSFEWFTTCYKKEKKARGRVPFQTIIYHLIPIFPYQIISNWIRYKQIFSRIRDNFSKQTLLVDHQSVSIRYWTSGKIYNLEESNLNVLVWSYARTYAQKSHFIWQPWTVRYHLATPHHIDSIKKSYFNFS